MSAGPAALQEVFADLKSTKGDEIKSNEVKGERGYKDQILDSKAHRTTSKERKLEQISENTMICGSQGEDGWRGKDQILAGLGLFPQLRERPIRNVPQSPSSSSSLSALTSPPPSSSSPP